MLWPDSWARIGTRDGGGEAAEGDARRGRFARLPPPLRGFSTNARARFCERPGAARHFRRGWANRAHGQDPPGKRGAPAAGSRHRAQVDPRLLAALHGADHASRRALRIPRFLADVRAPRRRRFGRLGADLPRLSRHAAGRDEEPDRQGDRRRLALHSGLDPVLGLQHLDLLRLCAARSGPQRPQHEGHPRVAGLLGICRRSGALVVFRVRRLGGLLRGDELCQAAARRRSARRDARPRGAGGAAPGAALPDQPALPVQHPQLPLLADPLAEDRRRPSGC